MCLSGTNLHVFLYIYTLYFQLFHFRNVLILLIYIYKLGLHVCLVKCKCRFGSARAVNRRYISDCVPLNIRMQASAGFVSASALGMACGPALAGLLQIEFKIFKLSFNEDTLPGWVMSVAWLLYLLCLWFTFKEPSHDTEEQKQTPHQANSGTKLIKCFLSCWAMQLVLIKMNIRNWWICFCFCFHDKQVMMHLKKALKSHCWWIQKI